MDYSEITKELGLNPLEDMKSAKLLNRLIGKPDLKPLEAIEGGHVIVFGAGPSLSEDVKKIKSEGLNRTCILVAADGAVKALLENGIIPQIQVTDLDGDIDAIIAANKRGAITVVHAHADNLEKIKESIPELKDVIGTTQLEPFGKLNNFGGFTDGDRAVYLIEHFKASLIILAGMDFGSEIGEYSGSHDKEFTMKKLRVGKQLLEELAERTHSRIVNITCRGERLKGISWTTVKQLRSLADMH